MNTLSFWSAESVFIELGYSSLKVLDRERGLELPLDRLENGRLTTACKETLTFGLKGFIKSSAWGLRPRAICALSASGVSLRRITLPAAADGDLERLLALQMEREFPLPPDALAWSYYRAANGDGGAGRAVQEFVVAAIKRDVLQEYAQVLSGCGLSPVFTLAALARDSVCSHPSQTYAILDIGRHRAELDLVENGALTAARIIAWGGEDVTHAIQTRLGISRDEAERLKTAPAGRSETNADMAQEVQACFATEAATLAGLVSRYAIGQKLYVTGESSRCDILLASLGKALGSGMQCDRIEFQPGHGRSAATIGLQRLCEQNGAALPLTFQINEETKNAQPLLTPWRWLALAALLVFTSLVLRYAEPFLAQPRLARRLAQMSSRREGLPSIDRELNFLQYLETNQPPLLDTLCLIANAAPNGARLDSVSMTRRGDFSLRGSMANAEQTSDFRSKLVESGFFNTVVMDEQSPTPDRQKITFRLTVQLKPNGERPPLPTAPAAKEAKPDKAAPLSTNQSARPPKAN